MSGIVERVAEALRLKAIERGQPIHPTMVRHLACAAIDAAEITRLNQQVETLTKERDDARERAEQAEHWMDDEITARETAERRLAEVREVVKNARIDQCGDIWLLVTKPNGATWASGFEDGQPSMRLVERDQIILDLSKPNAFRKLVPIASAIRAASQEIPSHDRPVKAG